MYLSLTPGSNIGPPVDAVWIHPQEQEEALAYPTSEGLPNSKHCMRADEKQCMPNTWKHCMPPVITPYINTEIYISYLYEKLPTPMGPRGIINHHVIEVH